MEKLTQVRNNIKKLKDECGSYKAFYERLHGKLPDRRNTQTFTNNINRGVFKAEFIIELMEAFDLEDVTLGEFFKGELQREEQQKEQKEKQRNQKDKTKP